MSSGEWLPVGTNPGSPSWSWTSYDDDNKFCGNDGFSRLWTTVAGEVVEEKKVNKDLGIEVVDSNVFLAPPLTSLERVEGDNLVLSGWQLNHRTR